MIQCSGWLFFSNLKLVVYPKILLWWCFSVQNNLLVLSTQEASPIFLQALTKMSPQNQLGGFLKLFICHCWQWWVCCKQTLAAVFCRRGSNVSLTLDMCTPGCSEQGFGYVMSPREQSAREYLQTASNILTEEELHKKALDPFILQAEFFVSVWPLSSRIINKNGMLSLHRRPWYYFLPV